MSWPLTKIETLRSIAEATPPERVVLSRTKKHGVEMIANDLRYGKGIFFGSPEHIDPLITDGLVEKVEIGTAALRGTTSRLTNKGWEAIRMLDGISNTSKYAMPDWVLQELTK